MTRWLVFANHVLSKSSLPPRDREIVILRIGWNCQSEYEWGQHVAIGKQAGISDDEIVRLTLRFSAQESGWSENERLLIDATDELKAFSKISDRTWAGLLKHYSKEQLMDVVFAVGQYNLVRREAKCTFHSIKQFRPSTPGLHVPQYDAGGTGRGRRRLS